MAPGPQTKEETAAAAAETALPEADRPDRDSRLRRQPLPDCLWRGGIGRCMPSESGSGEVAS